MYAVIKTGGKQYKVQKDDVIRVEKLDAEQGKTVTLDTILFNDGKATKLGDDAAKTKVTAEVLEFDRDDKVVIFKKKRRQNYRRKLGHKQHKTVLKITDIK